MPYRACREQGHGNHIHRTRGRPLCPGPGQGAEGVWGAYTTGLAGTAMLLAQPGFVLSLNKCRSCPLPQQEEFLVSKSGALWASFCVRRQALYVEHDVHICARRRWQTASMRSARPARRSHMAPATVAPALNLIPLRKRNAGPPARCVPCLLVFASTRHPCK